MNNDHFGSYPANYDVSGIISVAASDYNDKLAFFSNFGRKEVHVAAPGHKILSTVLGKRKYKFMSGTSMAAPHVSGLAAMLIGLKPRRFERRPAQLKNHLILTSVRNQTLNWRLQSGGIVNAHNALMDIIPEENRSPGDRRGEWLVEDVKLESAHPYRANSNTSFTVYRPGAKWLRVNFGRYILEEGKDRVEIYNKQGKIVDTITGMGRKYKSRAVKGDTLTVRLISDGTINLWGHEIVAVEKLGRE